MRSDGEKMIAKGERQHRQDQKWDWPQQADMDDLDKNRSIQLQEFVITVAARPGDVKNALEQMQNHIEKLMK
jgi:hypothetical protein